MSHHVALTYTTEAVGSIPWAGNQRKLMPKQTFELTGIRHVEQRLSWYNIRRQTRDPLVQQHILLRRYTDPLSQHTASAPYPDNDAQ